MIKERCWFSQINFFVECFPHRINVLFLSSQFDVIHKHRSEYFFTVYGCFLPIHPHGNKCVTAKNVKRTSPDTAIHEQNGYAKVYDDKYTFKTNVDNDKSVTTHTDMRNK